MHFNQFTPCEHTSHDSMVSPHNSPADPPCTEPIVCSISLTYVTLMPYCYNLRNIFPVRPPFPNSNQCVVVYAVSICQQPLSLNCKATTCACILAFSLPWKGEVGLSVAAEYLRSTKTLLTSPVKQSNKFSKAESAAHSHLDN